MERAAHPWLRRAFPPSSVPSDQAERRKFAALPVPLLLALPARVRVAVRYEQFPHTGGCHAGA